MPNKKRHQHYELLNLLGYGLAKFDNEFIKEFGYQTKSDFYQYFVDLGIAETRSVVKNRMDIFDPFFPNPRNGWWQRKEDYRPRKELIDSLFGNEDVVNYANIVKLYLQGVHNVKEITLIESPIVKSKFKRLQETGLEAELYFMNNYQQESVFHNGILEDARLYGDGYDFQISVEKNNYLAEVKGIRGKQGDIRLTSKEYQQAEYYKSKYFLSVVSDLESSPKLTLISNPLKQLKFEKVIRQTKDVVEYHLVDKL
ncbi:DUF3883 domain-containing protein [Streptococcus suis]|uniref:DUF3883 domain-containing protein n=1 Tax=Streptococcus suis TaxID=1307 RepID=UPI000CF4E3F6|nr:DUF3883 domain-containing protein [Streptococcus suis]